jgi:hypothetical protein
MHMAVRISSLPESSIPRVDEESSPSTFFWMFGDALEEVLNKYLYAPASLIADYACVTGNPAADNRVFEGWWSFARCVHVRPNV